MNDGNCKKTVGRQPQRPMQRQPRRGNGVVSRARKHQSQDDPDTAQARERAMRLLIVRLVRMAAMRASDPVLQKATRS